MDADLKKTIDAIRENTGIAVSVYTGRGEPLFGAEGKVPSGFEGVFRDAERNVTFFRCRASRQAVYLFRCGLYGRAAELRLSYCGYGRERGSRVPGTAKCRL